MVDGQQLLMMMEILKISGSEKNTTNNKMELMAPIKALTKN